MKSTSIYIIHKNIQEIMKYCSDNEDALMKTPSPYKVPEVAKKNKIKKMYHNISVLLQRILFRRNKQYIIQ